MQQPLTEKNQPIAATDNLYVGRQPIFDRHLKVYVYELLYRSAMH